MKLFKNNTLRQAQPLRQAQGDTMKDKAAKGISKVILNLQRYFAKFMGRQARRISASSLKFILVIFFLTGTGLSIYCVVGAFTEKENSKFIKIDRVRVPKYYDKNGDELVQPDILISQQEHEDMLAFESFMDSLQKTNLTTYDSIVLCRPGLQDSVKVLEQIYKQQKLSK